MVFCWNCGTENESSATNCKNCGVPLRRQSDSGRSQSKRRVGYEQRRGFPLGWIFIGIFILLVGVVWLMEGRVDWLRWDRLWPLAIVVIGLFVIVNTLVKR